MAIFTNSACAGGFQFDELWKRTKDELSISALQGDWHLEGLRRQ